jgi:AcrR family transcriptional regulator
MAKTARKRVREDAEERREHILDAAIRIIGQRGYYGFTVQELAQQCGLSNAGLLYHFGSKDELLVALVNRLERSEAEIMAPLVALAAQAAGRGGTSGEALWNLLHTMMARGSVHAELGRLYTVLLAESLDKAHPAYESFRARETTVLDLFTKLAAPYVPEPRATARQLLALMEGLAAQWLRADQAFDLLAEWDRAIAVLLPVALGSGAKQAAEHPEPDTRAITRPTRVRR